MFFILLHGSPPFGSQVGQYFHLSAYDLVMAVAVAAAVSADGAGDGDDDGGDVGGGGGQGRAVLHDGHLLLLVGNRINIFVEPLFLVLVVGAVVAVVGHVGNCQADDVLLGVAAAVVVVVASVAARVEDVVGHCVVVVAATILLLLLLLLLLLNWRRR